MGLMEGINRGTKGGYQPWDLGKALTVGLMKSTNRETKGGHQP